MWTEQLDAQKENSGRRYERFQEHGDYFIEVMDSGVPEIDDKWASAEQILEASEKSPECFDESSGNRVFVSIYNLLCDAEVMEAFHSSAPYEMDTDAYDTEDLEEALRYVRTGEA